MKKLLLSIALIISFSAISQTTVFNEGWDTQPVELLCAGSNVIVYETNYEGLRRYGKLIKYRMAGDEFEKTDEIQVSELLIDYRFDKDEKLQLIGRQPSHCDYYDSADFRVYTIDTSTFSIDTTRMLRFIDDFDMVSFASDSIIILTDYAGSKLYSLNSNQIVQSNLFASAIHFRPFIKGIFGGSLIISYNSGFGLTLENPKSSAYHYTGDVHKPNEVYSYGNDSILLFTDSLAFKMDTNLYPISSTPIPYHKRSKILKDRLYLLNGNVVYTFTLPGLNSVSTDTLRGLPTAFSLSDISVADSSSGLVALAGTKGSVPLRQLALKTNLNSIDETERHEIRIDSISLFAVSPAPSNLQPYTRVVTFNIFTSNHGSDTINGLKILYSDLPNAAVGIASCGANRDEYIAIKIPPGATKSFKQDVLISNSQQNFCFYLSVPGNRIEDDLSNNSVCQPIHIGLEEQALKNLYSIYPNPAAATVTLEGEIRDLESFELFAPDGRKVSVAVDDINPAAIVLNLRSLSTGIYYLRLEIKGQKIMKMVIKI